jgi:hypothetical protein
VTPRLTITSAGTPGGAVRAGHLGLQCSAGALLRGSLAVIKIRHLDNWAAALAGGTLMLVVVVTYAWWQCCFFPLLDRP